MFPALLGESNHGAYPVTCQAEVEAGARPASSLPCTVQSSEIKGPGWGLYPERVVEGLGGSLTEVELVGELTLLGLLRSHQFFFNHFFRCLMGGEEGETHRT